MVINSLYTQRGAGDVGLLIVTSLILFRVSNAIYDNRISRNNYSDIWKISIRTVCTEYDVGGHPHEMR